MGELAVITPTWSRDEGIFADLHRSVLEHTPAGTVHHVIVEKTDRAMFSAYEGERCRIWTHQDFLPKRYLHLTGTTWLNLRRPWPPVRGWIMQQISKLAVASLVDADVALIIDSDVVLVRPVRPDRFTHEGRLRLFRDEGAVTTAMERHVTWHRVARELLGLPAGAAPPLPDYVSPLGIWQPATVRAMQARVTECTGIHWADAFAGRMHISEFILYGVFVDEVLGASGQRPPAETSICHNSWERTPMDHEAAIAFAERLGRDAVAMMISSHSKTPPDIRAAATRRGQQVS